MSGSRMRITSASRWFPDMTSAPLLEGRSPIRNYGQVTALDGTGFSVYPGDICALIGDNDAGKSTLVEILSGVERRDGGEILLDRRRVYLESPAEAQALGIATV